MNLKRIAILLALPCLALAQTARADHDDDEGARDAFDFARVVRVEPQIRHVRVATPRRECYREEVPVYESERGHRSATPTILGGIIGGVVGHTMGQGNGKSVATVAGTILGGSIGSDIGYQNNPPRGGYARYASRDNCRVVDDYAEEERIEGYRVTYVYNDVQYVTHTKHDPGKRIRVRALVHPAE